MSTYISPLRLRNRAPLGTQKMTLCPLYLVLALARYEVNAILPPKSPFLLNYNSHIILYKFKVYNMMIWYTYRL